MSYNQTEQAFIEQVKSFENPEVVNRFLDLAKEMIEYCGLGEEDERLACAIRKEKGILTISIGRRWVFQMNYKAKFEDAYQIVFLFSEKSASKFTQNFSKFSPYNNQETPPVLVYFDFEKFKMTDEFNNIWLETTLEETKKISKSNLRGNHNPYFYKAIVDLDFRKKALDPNYIPENQSINPIPNPQNPMPNHPLNLILYGPPGTGKTYGVKEKAVRIIEPDYQGDINEKFKELKEAGQIEFVTFHQAFAYEEFIEGLSAETKEGQISYKIKDGIFKVMALKANENFLKAKIEKNNSIYLDFDEIFEEFIAPLYENEEKPVKVEMIKGFFKITKVDEDTIHFEKQTGTSLHNLSRGILKSIYENKREYRKDGLGVYYYPLVEKLRAISSSKPQKQEKLKNYVLIIDEINRANISKVFGELITLLEDTKRLGAKDEHTVRLPYSQDIFGVPQNLYLIGTMNTADRSIALLDIALRRRFEFEEMMPKTEVLKGIRIEGVELDKLLEKINQRIEFLLDRDHTIGHAYLLNISSLAELAKVFLNKIIPLLQEYFYDNWEKISLVLSNQEGKCDFLEVIDYQRDRLFKKVNSEMYLNEKKTSFKVRNLTQMTDNEGDKLKLISFFKSIYSSD